VGTETNIQRVGCYGLLIEDDRILLCRLAPQARSPGQWTLPGGGLEFGEHPDETVRREVREETGLTILETALLDIWSTVSQVDQCVYHVLHFIYSARAESGNLIPEATGSTDLCEWIPRDRVLDLPLVNLVRHGLYLLGWSTDAT
jgi:ADP-ribose pyrophosphatase YjhB (NUDIX family)